MESYERISFYQSCRGISDGMYAKWTIRNTGSPSGDRSADQVAARERQAGPTGMGPETDRRHLNHRATPRLHKGGG